MTIQRITMGLITAAVAACGTASTGDDPLDPAVAQSGTVGVQLPGGTLRDAIIEIPDDSQLLDTVSHHSTVYIHDVGAGAWYFTSGPYLLGIESFTQFHQDWTAWIDFGSGDKVAPAKARVVGRELRGQGWDIPSLDRAGGWPARIDSVWIVGTDDGRFGMGGAPEGIPLGTEVFGSMQSYGGALSTPYLFADGSPSEDSTRIRAQFAFTPDTLLGAHSAGASVGRRIGLDIGNTHASLYGTPNYDRQSGAYVRTESRSGHTLIAEVINNNDDPVTNVLRTPWNLVSLAWGTAKCHDYSGWDYQATTPAQAVCN